MLISRSFSICDNGGSTLNSLASNDIIFLPGDTAKFSIKISVGCSDRAFSSRISLLKLTET